MRWVGTWDGLKVRGCGSPMEGRRGGMTWFRGMRLGQDEAD